MYIKLYWHCIYIYITLILKHTQRDRTTENTNRVRLLGLCGAQKAKDRAHCGADQSRPAANTNHIYIYIYMYKSITFALAENQ